MKIRSITYFTDLSWPLDEGVLQAAGDFLRRARQAFEASGYEVQTTRLASTPFTSILGAARLEDLPRLAEAVEGAAQRVGVDYVSLGPARPEVRRAFEVIPEALAVTQNVFFSGEMASSERGISPGAVRACAEVIVRAASLTADGFANLRFAALANVPPGAPFFPAAYHGGGATSFALATEAADLAVQAFEGAKTVNEGQQALVAEIERHGKALAQVAEKLAREAGLRFGGVDFSLAPFPEEALSLGTAMERLGVPRVGLHGSLAAAAILTEAIERAGFPRAGFSGLMLPVLEDATLARRVEEGVLGVRDLLLYSAVCGTGLDTVPLPGDVSREALAALLFDLAALALRLNKPLTARLMPIPGKHAGDPTGFDFAFFANSRVMALEAETLSSPLGGEEDFPLSPQRR
ncbi:MAG: DUF711 family protein [Anaerolineae bacterium]|nr:MAG: DUF711 family protein [Anaerolineae bacterium]